MIRSSITAWFVAALRVGVPSAALLTAPLATGCHTFRHGRTPVAAGERYEPGSADYDAFFRELFDVQLLMGRAPERHTAAEARVAEALGLERGASGEQLGDALYARTTAMAKAGVSVKLSVEGLADGSPSATVVTIGEVRESRDQQLIDALDQSAKEAAQLLSDLRAARAPLERLRGRAAELETGIPKAFGARAKQAEVQQNFDDARQLMPLMNERADEVQGQVTAFLRELQRVMGSSASGAGPTPASSQPKGKSRPPQPQVKRPVAPPRAVPQRPAEQRRPPEPKRPTEPKKPAEPAAQGKAPEPRPPVAAPAQDFEP